jgi:hypothetical protein
LSAGTSITVNGLVDVKGAPGGAAGVDGGAGTGTAGIGGTRGTVAMTADTVTWIADQIADYDIQATTFFNWIPATASLNVSLDQSLFAGINAPLVRVGSDTTVGEIAIAGPVSYANLSLVTSGAISQAPGATLTLTGLNAYGGSVTLGEANDVATLQGRATTGDFTFANSGALGIGTVDAAYPAGISVAGDLALAAGGALTQSAVLTVTGNASLDAGANAITLNNAGNDFVGTVSLTGATTQITNASALTLGTLATGNLTANSAGAFNLGQGTVTGSLVADSGGGAISQSGALTVGGTSSLNAGAGAITLTDAGNDFQGAVSAAGSGISLADANALALAGLTTSGAATLNAGGAVTQTGAITAGSLELLGSGPYTLTNASNDIGVLAANTTGAISYRDANAFGVGVVGPTTGITSGNSDVSLQSGGALALDAAVNVGTAALSLTAGGAVSQTAAITVNGALNAPGLSVTTSSGDIVLANSGNRISTLSAASAPGNVTVVNGAADTLMDVKAASGTNVSFVSDQIIFSGPVSASAVLSFATANDRAIDVTPAFFTNVSASTMKLGSSAMTQDISLSGAIDLSSIANLSLITGGTIYQPTPASDSLTVAGLNADGGTVSLGGANHVTNLQGRATTGFFEFANVDAVNLTTVDAGNPVAGVISAGMLTVSADGGIGASVGSGNYAVQGTNVDLFSSAGSLGSASAPLNVRAAQLNALGSTGIHLALNAFNPAPVVIASLENLASGDIVVDAWGGLSTGALVDNPNGRVVLQTHSPMDILFGINAGQGISLTTSGAAPNDMFLAGPFTYASGGFVVNIGEPGVLTKGPSFSGTITEQIGGVVSDPLSVPEVVQVVGTVASQAASATTTNTTVATSDEEEKKKKSDNAKKGANVCK